MSDHAQNNSSNQTPSATTKDAAKETAKETSPASITVRAADGSTAAYFDPDQPAPTKGKADTRHIGEKPVTVVRTVRVERWLETKQIVLSEE
jgi:hypothetical protein